MFLINKMITITLIFGSLGTASQAQLSCDCVHKTTHPAPGGGYDMSLYCAHNEHLQGQLQAWPNLSPEDVEKNFNLFKQTNQIQACQEILGKLYAPTK